MKDKVQAYVKEHQLFCEQDKILVALSGGKDSVVLFDLLRTCGYSLAIAHCNFSLRESESDEDEAFVQQLAAAHEVPFFSRQFDTEAYAAAQGISIEMAARDLRYTWFEELIAETDYSHVATGHHLDDQIETFFNNLARGTGISGLRGIQNKYRSIVRPLLCLSREEIDGYVDRHKLCYREDRSNQELIYMRNLIRHKIVPVFKQINPSFTTTMMENMKRIEAAKKLVDLAIEQQQEGVKLELTDQVLISIEKLKRLEPTALYLFEFLSDYGFSGKMAQNIYESLDDISGKQFESPTHHLIKDRDKLIIQSKKDRLMASQNAVFKIYEETSILEFPIKMRLSRFSATEYQLEKGLQFANLDLDRIRFPLTLRKWQQGDWFIPYGMRGKKKLSDFFIDQKFSLFEKEKVWILCCGDEVIWIVGHRIDNRFSVREGSKNILQLELL